jgi:hypothetical protein
MVIPGRLRERLRYVDPSAREHRDYFDHLIAYNRTLQGVFAKELKQIPYSPFGNHIFMTTGSDARLEKGPGSTIEVVVLGANKPSALEVAAELNKYIAADENYDLFDQDIEVRYASDKSSDWFLKRDSEDEKTLVSITRPMDATKLAGDSSLLRNFKGGIVADVLGANGKSILHSAENRARQHKNILRTGRQVYSGEEIKHYDLERGIATYDPSHKMWSFKQGPLRAVQFALARDIARSIYSGMDPAAFFEVPVNTVEKLNALEVQGLLNRNAQQARSLCDNYKYFLWQYHKAQANYAEGITQNGFDSHEVRERLGEIDSVLSEGCLTKKSNAP